MTGSEWEMGGWFTGKVKGPRGSITGHPKRNYTHTHHMTALCPEGYWC